MDGVLLSVLDQSPISEGSTGAEALHNTLDLARLTDQLGYHRYWVAEHHGGPMLASASPEALIGPIAAATERIRVGSGGVMLPHYSPFKVAETFTVLAALFPGRIDLGIGRAAGHGPADDVRPPARPAPGGPGRLPPATRGDARVPRGQPTRRSSLRAPRADPARPPRAARGLAARIIFRRVRSGRASSVSPTRSPTSSTLTVPRSRRSTESGSSPERDLNAPRTAVAAWVLCAETDEEAQHLASSSRMTLTMLRRNQLIQVPPPETAIEFLAREGKPTTGALPGRRGIIGSPEKVRAGIEELAAEYGAPTR